MSCASRRPVRRAGPIYSDATTTGMFIPLVGPLEVSGATEIAVRSEVVGVTSSNLAWKPAIRYANAPDDLPTASPSDLGSEQTGAGVAYVTFAALPGTPRRWAELGYVVRNSAGSQVEKGMVISQFDLRLT